MNARRITIITILLISFTAPVWADLPQEMISYGNYLSFVANMADKCEFELRVLGKRGLARPECQDFLRKDLQRMYTFEEMVPMLKTFVENADMQRGLEITQWLGEVNANIRIIEKTFDHINFLK